MARPKQFSERIVISMVEGTTARIDALCSDQEYRLDFIRTAIEAEIEKRSSSDGRAKTRNRLAELIGGESTEVRHEGAVHRSKKR